MKRIPALALLGPFLFALPAPGGDLNPPAGPVAPTMKTLDEVEPRTAIHQADIPLTITTPGSYYLAENLTFPAATSGVVISIEAADVTLDLNGFTIDGQDVTGDAEGVIGITIVFSGSDILIRNGSIQRVTFGVNAQSRRRIFMDSLIVRPIDDGTGILASNDSMISNCRVEEGTTGIDLTVASNVVLRGCVVQGVSGVCYDFSFNNNGHIEDCVAIGGQYGYRLGDSADDLVFVDCIANSSLIGFSDLSGQTNFFYRNMAIRNNIAYQFIANVSATPATAGPWDNISQ